MAPLRGLLALALLAFLLAFVARLPARWLPKLLPAGVVCIEPSGTVWRGACANFEARGLRAGAIRWSFHPLRLLTGRAAATLRIAQPLATLEGEFAVTAGGTLEGEDLRGTLTLAPDGLLPGIPPDLEGRVALALDRWVLRERAVRALAGRIEVQELRRRSAESPLPLGSYELLFDGAPDASGNVVGRVADRGGPLDVEGRLTLTPAPGYLLEGTVATRPSAPPELARQIAFLGTPDAAGRRPFAQEATF
ncbi:MAG: type II secretion system protein N [Gammaproteobacteria bacterium]|nr:type II secretion system protein N [Gammaproteobacteria bacterium]